MQWLAEQEAARRAELEDRERKHQLAESVQEANRWLGVGRQA